jgi:hypothetical protein
MKRIDGFTSGLGISQVPARRVTAAWLLAGIALALAQAASAESAGWVEATGGEEMRYTENGTNYHAHIFRTPGTHTLTVTQGGEVNVLLVAGGGGGGGQGTWGGGGGAGGVTNNTAYVLTGGKNYTVVVGDGGLGKGTTNDAINGTDSVFGDMTAFGGGNGAGNGQAPGSGAGVVGSGGGGAGSRAGGVGTPGQGKDGGAGTTEGGFGQGGGGGAGGNGQAGTPTSGGAGGTGLYFAAFSKWGDDNHLGYFGGGGGGSYRGAESGLGGWGGGGKGAQNATGSGQPNTGGGGGGNDQGNPAGNGGSGVVIIRYPLPPLPRQWAVATGGTETDYTENGIHYRAHVFKTVGTNTLTVTQSGRIECLVVAGGGGGGGDGTFGGGGGAGGVIKTLDAVSGGRNYAVMVGDGGLGAIIHPAARPATSGANSVFRFITALGGGNGAGWAQPAGSGAGVVGSGGGAVGWWDTPNQPSEMVPGVGTPGQGSNGGMGSANKPYGQGGGGGAGGHGKAGEPTPDPWLAFYGGDGGIGLYFPEFANWGDTNHPGYFGGGGGGSYGRGGSQPEGGLGGWGGGGQGGQTKGLDGQANTGGGGGGMDRGGSAGNGGSGIVIIRYQRVPKEEE